MEGVRVGGVIEHETHLAHVLFVLCLGDETQNCRIIDRDWLGAADRGPQQSYGRAKL